MDFSIRRRRGSQFVEAALVYPVILTVTIFCMAVMVFFLYCTESASLMSMEARSLAGEETGTVMNFTDLPGPFHTSLPGYEVKTESGAPYNICRAGYTDFLKEPYIFNLDFCQTLSVKESCISEAKTIWLKEAVEDMKS